MGFARLLMYVLGAVLVVGGLVLLFFETGLDAWVPAGIALAGLVILIGLLVVGMSNRVTEPAHVRHVAHGTRRVEHHDHDRDENRPHTTPPQRIMTERNVERETSPGRSRVHTSTRTTRTTTRRSDEPRDH